MFQHRNIATFFAFTKAIKTIGYKFLQYKNKFQIKERRKPAYRTCINNAAVDQTQNQLYRLGVQVHYSAKKGKKVYRNMQNL